MVEGVNDKFMLQNIGYRVNPYQTILLKRLLAIYDRLKNGK